MSSIQTVVRVGISDLNIVRAPHGIRTSGLGSCVGIVIYDQSRKIAGLSHIMLPDSKMTKQSTNLNTYKYADTAIPQLIDMLCNNGARRTALASKIAGGAQMFQFASNSNVMRIGPRNVEAVQHQLSSLNIPIISQDVGGCWGRTIEFYPETSKLYVRSVNKGEKVI